MEIGSKTSLDTSTVSLIIFTDLENKAFKRYKCGEDTPGSTSSSAYRAHHPPTIPETHAARLPADRAQGALDPQAACPATK
jgi:hypothetical protein